MQKRKGTLVRTSHTALENVITKHPGDLLPKCLDTEVRAPTETARDTAFEKTHELADDLLICTALIFSIYLFFFRLGGRKGATCASDILPYYY